MNRDLILPLALIAFGGWMAWHCPRAARRELHAGVAEGLGSYRKSDEPLAFWITITLTFAAGALGLLFLIAGVTELLVYSGLIK
jgi:hypothetical protein